MGACEEDNETHHAIERLCVRDDAGHLDQHEGRESACDSAVVGDVVTAEDESLGPRVGREQRERDRRVGGLEKYARSNSSSPTRESWSRRSRSMGKPGASGVTSRCPRIGTGGLAKAAVTLSEAPSGTISRTTGEQIDDRIDARPLHARPSEISGSVHHPPRSRIRTPRCVGVLDRLLPLAKRPRPKQGRDHSACHTRNV